MALYRDLGLLTVLGHQWESKIAERAVDDVTGYPQQAADR
jgi:hypothetical protein